MEDCACADELPENFFENGLYVDPQQFSYSGYPFFEAYEDKKLELIKLFLPYDPVIIEVGAYEGATTLELARHWPFGKIFAFEPNPYPFERFLKNTQTLKNVTGVQIALDDYPGPGTLYFQPDTVNADPSWEERTSLLPPLSPLNFTVDVECETLEDWCKREKIPRVDFLYIDVDDWAVPVLDGSVDLLKTVNVICVKTQLSSFLGGPSLYYLLHRFLDEYGFEVVAHWYDPMTFGRAIYVKRTICEIVYR